MKNIYNVTFIRREAIILIYLMSAIFKINIIIDYKSIIV